MNDAVSLRNVFNAKRAMFIKQLIHSPDIVFMKFIFQVLKWACFVDYNSLYIVNVDIVTVFFCLSICIGCSRTALNIFVDLYPHYLTTANLIKN